MCVGDFDQKRKLLVRSLSQKSKFTTDAQIQNHRTEEAGGWRRRQGIESMTISEFKTA